MSDLFLSSEYLKIQIILDEFSSFSPEWFIQEFLEIKQILDEKIVSSANDFDFQTDIAKRNILKFIQNDKRTSLERGTCKSGDKNLTIALEQMQNCDFENCENFTFKALDQIKLLYPELYFQYLKDLFLYMRGIKIMESVDRKISSKNSLDNFAIKDCFISCFRKEFELHYPKKLFELANYSVRDYGYVYFQLLIKKELDDI